MVFLDILVMSEPLAARDLWVLPATPVHKVTLDHVVLREKTAFAESKETKETGVVMVLPASKETWDPREIRESMDLLDPVVKMASMELEAVKVLVVSLAQLVLSERRAKWEFLDFLDTPDERDRRDVPVLKEPEADQV